MRRNKTLIATSLVLSLGVVFGGCSFVAKQADVTTETPTKSLTGVVSVSNGVYFLKQDSGVTTTIDSRKIKLADYVGKTVTLTGEFSGSTLFADKAE